MGGTRGAFDRGFELTSSLADDVRASSPLSGNRRAERSGAARTPVPGRAEDERIAPSDRDGDEAAGRVTDGDRRSATSAATRAGVSTTPARTARPSISASRAVGARAPGTSRSASAASAAVAAGSASARGQGVVLQVGGTMIAVDRERPSSSAASRADAAAAAPRTAPAAMASVEVETSAATEDGAGLE